MAVDLFAVFGGMRKELSAQERMARCQLEDESAYHDIEFLPRWHARHSTDFVRKVHALTQAIAA